MGRVLPVLVLLALMVYCVVEVAQAESYSVRALPKWLWAVVVIFLPGIGPVLWLGFGRPHAQPSSQPPSKDIPPDDDPEFLHKL